MVPGVRSVDRGNWGRERDSFLYHMFAFSFVNDVLYRMLITVNVLERIAPYTFIPHTKNGDRFRNGSLHESYIAWKTCQVSKVHAQLVLTRYQMSHVWVPSTKTLTKDYDYWPKNKLWCWEEHRVKKKTNDNCRKQTELEQTEDDANNVRLDKGNTQLE